MTKDGTRAAAQNGPRSPNGLPLPRPWVSKTTLNPRRALYVRITIKMIVPTISAKTPTLLIWARKPDTHTVDQDAERDQNAAEQYGILAASAGRSMRSDELEPWGDLRQGRLAARATDASVITAQAR